MAETNIICKPTLDTFVRFFVVLAAFTGFGLYFFYDASVGYRKANEVYFSYQAFARLGDDITTKHPTPAAWEATRKRSPLIESAIENGESVAREGDHTYPLPAGCEATLTSPPEACNFNAMQKSWNDCWLAYTARMHYPSQPVEHAYDAVAIREQWYAGGVCMLISAVLLALMIRTSRRTMALRGDVVTAAGQTFRVSDITRLDLRQWGKGYKGVAYATVNGRKIRLDGMTYGGFNPKNGEPAEAFMRALHARYQGEILEYEET